MCEENYKLYDSRTSSMVCSVKNIWEERIDWIVLVHLMVIHFDNYLQFQYDCCGKSLWRGKDKD